MHSRLTLLVFSLLRYKFREIALRLQFLQLVFFSWYYMEIPGYNSFEEDVISKTRDNSEIKHRIIVIKVQGHAPTEKLGQ